MKRHLHYHTLYMYMTIIIFNYSYSVILYKGSQIKQPKRTVIRFLEQNNESIMLSTLMTAFHNWTIIYYKCTCTVYVYSDTHIIVRNKLHQGCNTNGILYTTIEEQTNNS